MSANDLSPTCPDCKRELYLVAEAVYVPLAPTLQVGGTCLICEEVFQADYTYSPPEEAKVDKSETRTEH